MMSVYDSPVIFRYCIVLAAVIGAVFGSFLNCTAFRIARGESFTKGRSKCPECGHELSWKDLIPIVSWLSLKGKCRYCGHRISPRYFIAEVFFALITVGCLLKFDLTLECLRNYVFACCLFTLSLVDLDSMEIPDGCLLVALVAWLAVLPFMGIDKKWVFSRIFTMVGYVLALLAIVTIMDKVLKKESMGGGDIKLFGLTALYLGFFGTLFEIVLACIIGLVFAGLTHNRGKAFPFGPSIAAAAWIMLVYGQGFVSWYMRLLGVS